MNKELCDVGVSLQIPEVWASRARNSRWKAEGRGEPAVAGEQQGGLKDAMEETEGSRISERSLGARSCRVL